MVIFLDFDGVLHPIPTDGRGEFCHMNAFEDLLREFSEKHGLEVVISSSWREVYPWLELVEFFAEDVRSHIRGITPMIKGGSRYEEIQAWIAENKFNGSWLAIDDAVGEFPNNCENLIQCQTAIGLDKEMIDKIRQRFLNCL